MGDFTSWRRKVSPAKVVTACLFAVGSASMFFYTRSYGQTGIAVTLVLAAAVTGIIYMCGRNDLVAILNITVSTVFGASFGLMFLSGIILSSMHGYAHNAWEHVESEIIGVIAGAIIGAMLPAFAAHSRSRPR